MALIQNLNYLVLSKLADMHTCIRSARGWYTLQFEGNGVGQVIVLIFICMCIDTFKNQSGLKKLEQLCEAEQNLLMALII